MKNLRVFYLKNFFLSLTFLGKTKQGISSSICFFLAIVNLKVVAREFFGLLNLFKIQALDINELVKIVTINENKNLKFAAF